ncbi:MAG: hypothetical protein ACKV1O_30925 [Saprospiraceae bacterium]
MTTALNPDKLEFSYNWNNKLDCTYFTTLRLSGRFKEGDVVEIWEKKLFKGEGRIVKKRAIMLKDITDVAAYLDTGYNAEETRNIIKKMYPKITNWDAQTIYYYLIHKTARI